MKTSSASRWWDLPAAFLLLIALQTVATRLVVTEWTEHLEIVQTLAFLGLAAGLALGKSIFSPRLAVFFAIAYGLFAVPWQLGNTLGSGILWTERLVSLGGRLWVILEQLVRQEVVLDSLLFLILMSILFWVISVFAGYAMVRYGNAWRAVLPAGIVLFVIHSFDAVYARRIWYIAVYIFISLVIVARVSYLHQHRRWQNTRTALPPQLGLDFIRFTLLSAAVLVLFSWTAPALAKSLPPAEQIFLQIKQPWNEARSRFENAFASLRSSVGLTSDYYGKSLLLGRGNELSDSQVLQVFPPAEAPITARYYWRARTFDYYEDGQWSSSTVISQRFDPEEEMIAVAERRGRWSGVFEFVPSYSISTIFSPAQLIWVSRPSSFEGMMNPDGLFDISAFTASPAIRAGERYKTRALLSDPTVNQLLTAGIDYPDWVRDRYLQVPASITPRTVELAKAITEGLDTPYEKAAAITDFLRENIEYTETVPERPAGQEPLDWFLFDLRQGFCNYYASAEVILLRAAGVPARWSVGYAQGEQAQDGSFTVRQRDAHAWPEVYFPGIGWVEFEPTSSQPVITRLSGEERTASGLYPDSNLEDKERRLEDLLDQELKNDARPTIPTQPAPNWGRIAAMAIPLVIGIAVLAGLLWKNRSNIKLPAFPVVMETTLIKAGIRPPEPIQFWARRAELPPLAKCYMEINNALARLGAEPAATDTPAERAERLIEILPGVEASTRLLVNEYQSAMFSARKASLEEAREAGTSIRNQSYRAFFQSVVNRSLNKILAGGSKRPAARSARVLSHGD